MAGNSLLPDQEEEPSTLGTIVSSIITVFTLLGLLYCFRRASTLFPRSMSIPLDNFMGSQRTRGGGPIALSDDDYRDAEALEDHLYVGEDDDDEDQAFEASGHPASRHRFADERRDDGARPLLPTTTVDIQRPSFELEGDDDDDDEDLDDRELLKGGEAQTSAATVYDIESDDDDDDTAIRAPFKDEDEENAKY